MHGALDEYVARRDFSKTPEPGLEAPAVEVGPELAFAVQQHSAQRLHYDLRLELDGVLKSWAVPNGPSLNPDDRRLAVMTEDHPRLYTRFEGVIPRGQYGAGEMIVWDRGTYAPESAGASREEQAGLIRRGLEAGKLTIALRGRKLSGLFTLVRTSRGQRDWLLIKKQDGHASRERDVLADGRSVISGLTLEDLKAGRRPSAGPARSFAERLRAAPGVRSAAFPEWVEPMAASPAEHPFSNPRWLFEPKLDGYRVVASVRAGRPADSGDRVGLRSRRGLDSTRDYPRIAAELAAQPRELVLDGEVVALDEQGRPSFDVLKLRLEQIKKHRVRSVAAEYPLTYYVFDLLYCDGYDLRGAPLAVRKALLAEALVPTESVRPVEYVEAEGGAFYEAVRGLGLEGMVAKHRESIYESRRSPSWLKIKAIAGDEFVVGGYTRGNGARADTLGALLLGQYDADERLRYVGHVGSGFDEATIADLRRRLDALRTEESPFDEKVLTNAPPVWVRPELVAEVQFSEMTRENRLRAPVFVRVRPDKAPADARRVEFLPSPRPEPADALASVLDQLAAPASGQPARSLVLEVGGEKLSLTSLDKELWPGVTKRQLLVYLARVSPHVLPHLKDRPLTLIRYPDGIGGERFYQKHWSKGRPDFVETVVVYSDHNVGDEELVMVNNLPSLLWLGQVGALEFHAWYSRTVPEPDGGRGTTRFAGDLENMKASLLNHPDYVVFDLDPVRAEGQAVPRFERETFRRVCEVAHWLRELLDSLSLSSFVKTTGRSGLHVFVPIRRRLDYDATRAISQTVAQFLRAQHPKEIALEWALQRRVGEVFVDTNQNVRGKTLVSAYSPRATDGATVAVPLRWDEVGRVFPQEFTILTVPDRLAGIGDLWSTIHEAKADLASALGLAA
ncbi:MAG TPA: non-homologous end-joining DNA ligase [Chloroflexota bacterium]